MKLKAIGILKEQLELLKNDIDGVWIDPKRLDEAIAELESLEIRKCENCSKDYVKCRIFVAYWNKTKTSCIFDSQTFYCSLHSWKK